LITSNYISSNAFNNIIGSYISSNVFNTLINNYQSLSAKNNPITPNSLLTSIDNTNAYYSFYTGSNYLTFLQNTVCDVLIVGPGGNSYSNIYAGGGGAGEIVYLQNYTFAPGNYLLNVASNSAPSYIRNLANPLSNLLYASPGTDGGFIDKITSNNARNYILTGGSNALLRFNYDDITTVPIVPNTYNIYFNNNYANILTSNVNIGITITDKNNIDYAYATSNSFPQTVDSNSNIINPVLWYKFNEYLGTTQIDYSSSTTLGTKTGSGTIAQTSVQLPSFKMNANFLIVGASGAQSTNAGQLPINDNNGIIKTTLNSKKFTISFWISLTTTYVGDTQIFRFGENSSTSFFKCVINYATGPPVVRIINFYYGSSLIVASFNITTNTVWHFICITIDSSATPSNTIYIDNLKMTTSTSFTPTTTNLFSSNIIGGPSSSSFLGSGTFNLSDLRIYNSVLNQNQVSDLYNGVVEVFSRPGIDGYYNTTFTSNVYSYYMRQNGNILINGYINNPLNTGFYNIIFDQTGFNSNTISVINTKTNRLLYQDKYSYSILNINPFIWYTFISSDNTTVNLTNFNNVNNLTTNSGNSKNSTSYIKGSNSILFDTTYYLINSLSGTIANNFTISFWLYALANSGTQTIFKFIQITNDLFNISIDGTNNLIISVNGTAIPSLSYANIINKWQYITVNYSYITTSGISSIIVYINGNVIYVSNNLYLSNFISSITGFNIGNNLKGSLSDFRIYNQSLTSDQVRQLYTGCVQIIYGNNYNIGSGGGGGGGYINDAVSYSNIFASGSNVMEGGIRGISNIFNLTNYNGANATLISGGAGGGIGTTINIMGINNPITVGTGGVGGSTISYQPIDKSKLYGFGADGNYTNAIGGPGLIIIKFPYTNNNISSNILCFANNNITSLPSIGSFGGLGDKIIIAPTIAFNNKPDYPFSIGYYSSNLWYSVPSWGTNSWYIGGQSVMTLTNDISYVPYSYDDGIINITNQNTTIPSMVNQLSVGSPGNYSCIVLYDGNNGNYPNSGNLSSGVASTINGTNPTLFTSNSWRILASTTTNIDNFYSKYPYSTLSFTYGPNNNNDYNNILTGGGANGNNIHMYLTGGGQLYVYDDIISFNSASDMKLKENVKKMSESLTMISKFNPVEFTWKNIDEVIERKRTTIDYGFIAQEVEKILPHLVHEGNDYKVIKYEKIVPFLVKGMQELNERLSIIEKKLNIHGV
jgi:hypothetical protein